MERIGFEVVLIENPENAKQVCEIINAFVHRGDQIDCNAFGVAFMSHGTKNGRMATYFDEIRVEEIVDRVKGANTLIGKPKLFIFQGEIFTCEFTHN